jgi:hypothetical protein
MSQRKSKRHLEFESLEAMELLSGAGMAVPHAGIPQHVTQVHRATKGAVSDVELVLSGTIRGPYHTAGGGTAVGFTGQGTVKPIGKAQLQGTLDLTALPLSGRMTLNFGRRGKVFAAIAGLGPPAPQGTYLYQITGGTRTFTGDTGSGLASLDSRAANQNQPQGRFTLTLSDLPT